MRCSNTMVCKFLLIDFFSPTIFPSLVIHIFLYVFYIFLFLSRLVSEVWFTACMHPSQLQVRGGRAMDQVAGGGLIPSSFSSCHAATHQRSPHVPAAGRGWARSSTSLVCAGDDGEEESPSSGAIFLPRLGEQMRNVTLSAGPSKRGSD